MPMELEGSCQCGGVEFTLLSQTPVPYQLCACSICRKVGGHLGSVNLGGIADSLDIIKGKDLIKKYSAIKDRGTPDEKLCSSERNFCLNCSTMLWVWDHHWPELIHPFASAIDTELPVPDEMVCIMEGSKPAGHGGPRAKKLCMRSMAETVSKSGISDMDFFSSNSGKSLRVRSLSKGHNKLHDYKKLTDTGKLRK